MVKHSAVIFAPLPKEQRGYQAASLFTTHNGLGLIEAALREYHPEPCEGTLCSVLLSTITTALNKA